MINSSSSDDISIIRRSGGEREAEGPPGPGAPEAGRAEEGGYIYIYIYIYMYYM